MLIAACAVILVLSPKLKPETARPEVKIDMVGVVLAAASVILIVFGFNT